MYDDAQLDAPFPPHEIHHGQKADNRGDDEVDLPEMVEDEENGIYQVYLSKEEIDRLIAELAQQLLREAENKLHNPYCYPSTSRAI